MKLLAPEPLVTRHKLDSFDCGESSLDEWLRRRALANKSLGASRTFVATTDSHEVMGYYALATGSVHHQGATRSIRRNMPDPIPVMVLCRLAVDVRAQGKKLGASLLQDAWRRCVSISQDTGVRAMLVHALNERAYEFYEHYGFKPSPVKQMTLFLPLNRPPV